MPATVVCRACGLEHKIPDRRYDPVTGTTSCPNCGARPYTVRRYGIAWHPC